LAKKNGADGIEFDVSQTKDKQNIVIHGDRMRPTVCGKDYVIASHTREELKKDCPLKNGESLMTLEEMLKSVDGLFDYYFVEIKVYIPKDAEAQTTAAIQTVKKL
jgi:glycerophosphoryl diester phosphodiesterase